MLSKYFDWPTALLLFTVLAVQVLASPVPIPTRIEAGTSSKPSTKSVAETNRGDIAADHIQGTFKLDVEAAVKERKKLFVNPNGPSNTNIFNKSWKYGVYSKHTTEGSAFLPSTEELKDYWGMFRDGPAKKVTQSVSRCFGRGCSKPEDQ